MQECEWIVELEPGVWLTTGEGDPPRTLDFTQAKGWRSLAVARVALKQARKFHPFVNATINPV